MALTPSPRRHSKALNQVVAAYMARKGLCKASIIRDMRQQDQHCFSPSIYAYEPEPPQSPQQQLISLIFKSKPPSRPSPRRKTGSIKSADEVVNVMETEEGRIVIPVKDYHRALRKYKGEQVIMDRLKLRETEEMNRHFQRLADLISPSYKKETRLSPRRVKVETKPTTSFNISEMKSMLSIRRRARSATPGVY